MLLFRVNRQIKSKGWVKGSGQECPLHTGKGRAKSSGRGGPLPHKNKVVRSKAASGSGCSTRARTGGGRIGLGEIRFEQGLYLLADAGWVLFFCAGLWTESGSESRHPSTCTGG